MPLYEYVAREDGAVIELLRPMGQADALVVDPDGKGRTFLRRQSTFAAGGSANQSPSGRSVPLGGCCPCGKSAGQCGRG